MPKILTISEKMERVKSFLKENGIAYWENHPSKRCKVLIPLAIPKYQVAVHPEDDQLWFEMVRKTYRPVFIRDGDTARHAIEKVQNTIVNVMMEKQRKIMRKEEKRRKHEEYLRKHKNDPAWYKRKRRKRVVARDAEVGHRNHEKAYSQSNAAGAEGGGNTAEV